jgi:PITH domain
MNHGPGLCECHTSSQDIDPTGTDLLGSIYLDAIVCLNERTPKSGKLVFKTQENKLERDLVIQSNERDPELLVYVPFICPVKVLSIIVIGGGNGTTPSEVRIFKNQDSLDFSNVQNMTPVQSFELLENPYGDIEYPTRVSKFSSTNSLYLHFPRSTGADYLEISYIGIKGESSNYRRTAVIAVYESKPMSKDHKAWDEASGQHEVR